MTVFAANKALTNSFSQALLEYVATDWVCPMVTLNSTVCPGIIPRMAPYVIKNLAKNIFFPAYVCEEVIPICQTELFETSTAEEYVNELLQNKPKAAYDNDYIN